MALPLAITAGEPAGIGPDLCVLLAQQTQSRPLVVIADPDMLQARATQLGLPLHIELIEHKHPPSTPSAAGSLAVDAVPLHGRCIPGKLDPINAGYVLQTLDRAIDGCMQSRYGAMVTAPVHKGVINEAGIGFSGHTEYIAHRTGGHPVMMLTCPGLRVALATTHLPLRAVADAITPPTLTAVLRIVDADLRNRFSIPSPRILVCGLNPHAGEGGHLGTEEQQIIEPVVAALRDEGLNLLGPLPADTAFTEPLLADVDAVLAMYHDQGLPVLKHKGFGEAVNITLGLPIVRTSVDHGTALDLAGRGGVNDGSLLAAIECAALMGAGNATPTALQMGAS